MDTFSHQLDPKIRQTAQKLSDYTLLLEKVLPPECMNHFNVANIHNKTIVIVADSPVWTTRLRQLGPMILEAMSAQSSEALHHVKIITRHGPKVDKHDPPVTKRQLSVEAGQIIEQTASYLNDEQLSDALLKLSRHRSNDNNKN